MERIVCLILIAASVTSDYMPNVWAGAVSYHLKPGEKTTLEVFHRDNTRNIPLRLKKRDIVKATVQSKNGSVDLLPTWVDDQSLIPISLPEEGTYAVNIRSNPTLISLAADSMNAYVKANDLEDVQYSRSAKQQLTKDAKVMSSWCSTVLLQVGTVTDDAFKNGSVYPLEIVPEKNPYAIKVGEKVRFTILWNGKPLFGARVIVRIVSDNNTGIQHIYSGKDGVIEAPLGNKATWVVNVAKMVPSRNPDADWQAYQASFTFGY